MNKQEVIDEIENAIPDFILNDFQRGKETGLTYALELVNQLDEPEKPVVPKFVAEWIKSQKESFSDASAIDMYDNLTLDNNGGYYHEVWLWVIAHHYDFIKAWHDGYEVEKEKRYTAKLKLTDEYLFYYASIKDLHHAKTTDNLAKREKVFHFTEDDLVKYHVWENTAYEVNEVR